MTVAHGGKAFFWLQWQMKVESMGEKKRGVGEGLLWSAGNRQWKHDVTATESQLLSRSSKCRPSLSQPSLHLDHVCAIVRPSFSLRFGFDAFFPPFGPPLWPERRSVLPLCQPIPRPSPSTILCQMDQKIQPERPTPTACTDFACRSSSSDPSGFRSAWRKSR